MATHPSNNDYQKKWFAKNKVAQRERVRARILEIRKWFQEYKATLKCERCPESHPSCLDFHHRDPSQKESGITKVVQNGAWGRERIMREIAKCEVLCANCHRKEHHPIVA